MKPQLLPGEPQLGERHLEALMLEAKCAFNDGNLREAIVHLSQAVLVASKGNHNLDPGYISHLVNRVNSAAALSLETW